MRTLMTRLFFALFALTLSYSNLQAEEAFTGKITGNHVRMRLQPSLDATVVDELDKEDLVVVLGESDDFWAVQPPKYIKAYVSANFINDGKIHGNRVNIRLDPHLDAPVIAQLEDGTPVEGVQSHLSNKWFEIQMPEEVHLFISKHFVERIGGPELAAQRVARQESAGHLLATTVEIADEEMKKPFNEIQIEPVLASLNKIVETYPELITLNNRAKAKQTEIQESYLKKKVIYLEAEAALGAEKLGAKLPNLEDDRLAVQMTLEAEAPKQVENHPQTQNARMSQWIPAEEKIFAEWQSNNPEKGRTEFEKEQNEESISLKGVIRPYDRAVRNKPGDWILVNRVNELPIAYLYSTNVNLQNFEGQEVTVKASIRPNHHFAYPAYFVISAE